MSNKENLQQKEQKIQEHIPEKNKTQILGSSKSRVEIEKQTQEQNPKTIDIKTSDIIGETYIIEEELRSLGTRVDTLEDHNFMTQQQLVCFDSEIHELKRIVEKKLYDLNGYIDSIDELKMQMGRLYLWFIMLFIINVILGSWIFYSEFHTINKHQTKKFFKSQTKQITQKQTTEFTEIRKRNKQQTVQKISTKKCLVFSRIKFGRWWYKIKPFSVHIAKLGSKWNSKARSWTRKQFRFFFGNAKIYKRMIQAKSTKKFVQGLPPKALVKVKRRLYLVEMRKKQNLIVKYILRVKQNYSNPMASPIYIVSPTNKKLCLKEFPSSK